MSAPGRLSVRALCVLCCVSACAEPEPRPGDAGPVERNTIVVLPDTQFYACAYPQIFEQQTRWIVEQQAQHGIAAVVHTGDIVDTDDDEQWQTAADSMHRLDGIVPYLMTTGNHDMDAVRASRYASYFDARQLERASADSGTYDAERLDNSYAVLRVAGRDWLLLGIEFGPRDQVLGWANQILAQHAELPAVLFTHAYLYSDGQRYDRTRAPRQPYHPDLYAFTPEQGINDGEDLWRKLVEPNPNVRLVLSGHVIPDGTAHSSVSRADGSTVHQVLANYQHCDLCPCAEYEGGGGYLRVLDFTDQELHVSTYSPHRDHWLTDEQNDFRLEL